MATSSTLSLYNNYQYDVFLSFRGEDIRKTFIDHFYEALQRQGIHTFKDDERLRKGRKMEDELLKSIENSRFYIIVFSKNYASSRWCLNELVKIMECQKIPGNIAYPVFYDVEPSEIRNQSGAVEEAFALFNNEDAAGKWRDAMNQAGNLAGWVLKNTADGNEAKFIKRIVEQISLELRSINVYIDKKIIGMEPRIEKVLSSLKNETGFDDVRMIGIKGIGGGGKTTLARAIFDTVSTQFEGVSFVENVREASKTFGLEFLQKKILSNVLEDQGIIVSSVHDGKRMMQTRLRGKRVLVVLDDVDHISQLEALAEEPNWFKDGSRIIITTREEQVLRAHRVNQIHDVDLLSNEEALCLFSRYAFGSEIPNQRYKELSLEVIDYAAGLPLIIRVLGAFLCGKDELEWIDELARLRTYPLEGTLDKLELSYIGLEDDLKEMFLDVACFLKGSHKDDAIRILESCGFYPRIGLRVLEQKSLITISDDQRLGMHDRIQEMGWNIVRRLHPDQPNRHSRLWIREEIEDVVANDLGSDEITAIAVDDSHVELSSEIVARGFGNMERLRFLRLVCEMEDDYSHWDERTHQVSQNFPYALCYLSWAFYPCWSLSETFLATNLVALELPDCRIRHLWEGEKGKVLKKLRFLVLSYSKLSTLDLRLTPNLEKLDLEGCCDLIVLHTPVGCLKKLISLNLSGCSRMTSFSFISRLESLKVLCLTRLYLKVFDDIIPRHCQNSLLELRLRNNDIEELPSSIGMFHRLVYLDLHSCTELRSLPGSICGLRNLKNLNLYGCILEELPEDFGRLEWLEKLNLSFTRITHLPNSICMLKRLKKLNLSSCGNLENLPEDLGRLECLQNLILTKCTRVSYIPDSICQLKRLKYFSVLGCIQLEKLPKKLGILECLEVLNVKGTRIRQLPRNLYLLGGLRIYEAKSVLQSRGYASTSGTLEAYISKKRKFDHR